jgi:hypothetical protein
MLPMKIKNNHLPRNGQYEIFTTQGRTYCFDDPSLEPMQASSKMFEWLRNMPRELCRPLDHTNVAFYLTPEMYTLWKITWL